jgi:DNA-binding CsgD family transcriptional regulator
MPRRPGDSEVIRQRRLRILKRLANGQTAGEVAGSEGVSIRTVYAVKAEAREQLQGTSASAD